MSTAAKLRLKSHSWPAAQRCRTLFLEGSDVLTLVRERLIGHAHVSTWAQRCDKTRPLFSFLSCFHPRTQLAAVGLWLSSLSWQADQECRTLVLEGSEVSHQQRNKQSSNFIFD